MTEHKWKFQRVGGSPAEADSYEYVRFCEVCGMEDNCEDDLPPCEGDATLPESRPGLSDEL